MALVEYYIGNSGPFFMDDTDPLYSDPGQVATKADVAAIPVAGVTSNITVVTDIGPPQVTSVLHFTNGLLTSVT